MNEIATEEQLQQTIIRIIKERQPQTVEQLVSLVEERLSVPEQKIIESVVRLRQERKIALARHLQSNQPHLKSYVRTDQALWYWITIATATAITAIVFTIPENLYPWVYARYILGAIFVIGLPGYAFMKALFPTQVPIKLPTESLDALERIALSLGMSLALVPIVGLLLNYTPWGIRLTPIVLSLLVITIVFSTAAIIRERQIEMKVDKSAIRAK